MLLLLLSHFCWCVCQQKSGVCFTTFISSAFEILMVKDLTSRYTKQALAELITGLPGFPSLCIFHWIQKRVLGGSTFSPSETLLWIKLSFLSPAVTLLSFALFSVIRSCSECLQCLVLFNCLSDSLMQCFKSSVTTVLHLSAFAVTISSVFQFKFIFDSVFCCFYESFGSVMIFTWSTLFVGWYFKNVFLCLFFNFSVTCKTCFQLHTSVKIIHFFIKHFFKLFDSSDKVFYSEVCLHLLRNVYYLS